MPFGLTNGPATVNEFRFKGTGLADLSRVTRRYCSLVDEF